MVSSKLKTCWAGGLGLVVMGGDSCSEVFESQHRQLDNHFSQLFVVKNCNVCLKSPK